MTTSVPLLICIILHGINATFLFLIRFFNVFRERVHFQNKGLIAGEHRIDLKIPIVVNYRYLVFVFVYLIGTMQDPNLTDNNVYTKI